MTTFVLDEHGLSDLPPSLGRGTSMEEERAYLKKSQSEMLLLSDAIEREIPKDADVEKIDAIIAEWNVAFTAYKTFAFGVIQKHPNMDHYAKVHLLCWVKEGMKRSTFLNQQRAAAARNPPKSVVNAASQLISNLSS